MAEWHSIINRCGYGFWIIRPFHIPILHPHLNPHVPKSIARLNCNPWEFLIFTYLFIWLCWVIVVTLSFTWDLVSWPGIEPERLHWGCRILATGPPGSVPAPGNFWVMGCSRSLMHCPNWGFILTSLREFRLWLNLTNKMLKRWKSCWDKLFVRPE